MEILCVNIEEIWYIMIFWYSNFIGICCKMGIYNILMIIIVILWYVSF